MMLFIICLVLNLIVMKLNGLLECAPMSSYLQFLNIGCAHQVDHEYTYYNFYVTLQMMLKSIVCLILFELQPVWNL